VRLPNMRSSWFLPGLLRMRHVPTEISLATTNIHWSTSVCSVVLSDLVSRHWRDKQSRFQFKDSQSCRVSSCWLRLQSPIPNCSAYALKCRNQSVELPPRPLGALCSLFIRIENYGAPAVGQPSVVIVTLRQVWKRCL